MSYQININKFTGPLDLLLQLIEKQELDIAEVSLAQVTDQYIEYLKKLEELMPVELADFLVVAARLLVIKSKTLLPYLTWDEEEEADAAELEKQLRLYKEFAVASKAIQKIINQKRFAFFRAKPITTQQIIFSPPKKQLTTQKLKQIFVQVLQQLETIMKLPEQVLQKTISLKARINRLRDLLLNKAEISFDELLKEAKNKTEMVVNFLALLELIKQKEIVVEQDKIFSGIMIKRKQDAE